MPFDGRDYYKTTTEPLQTGLAGLKQLADQLRLPLKHEWDFHTVSRDCCTTGCAIMTAHLTWPKQIPRPSSCYLTDALNIPLDDLEPILGLGGGRWPYGNKKYEEVSPHDVADAIDRFIAGREQFLASH